MLPALPHAELLDEQSNREESQRRVPPEIWMGCKITSAEYILLGFQEYPLNKGGVGEHF